MNNTSYTYELSVVPDNYIDHVQINWLIYLQSENFLALGSSLREIALLAGRVDVGVDTATDLLLR